MILCPCCLIYCAGDVHLAARWCWTTPWKINIKPTNHPFRKENDLNQTSMIMFHINLQGCILNWLVAEVKSDMFLVNFIGALGSNKNTEMVGHGAEWTICCTLCLEGFETVWGYMESIARVMWKPNFILSLSLPMKAFEIYNESLCNRVCSHS